jgi:acetate kinase
MSTYILVLNCGSSSVKFAVINPTTKENILSGLVERIGSALARTVWRWQEEKKQERALGNINYQDALSFIFELLDKTYKLKDQISAIGHRVVHGGEYFTEATIIDDKVWEAIKTCAKLAPLHNPANMLGIEAAKKAFPTLQQTAVFDTAFHQTMPRKAYIYPIPYEFYTKHAIRRYGFHGTSHKFVSKKASEILHIPLDECSFITAHLGNGCSAAAIFKGKSVDTTMGLTPLEGLMMGTRSGDVDPGLHEHLADNLKLDIHKITEILNKKSGLLGVSGVHSDMRGIEEAAEKGEESSVLALEIFCYRLAKNIAALTIGLSGKLDALIFTGGIGENSPVVRKKTLALLPLFGFEIDDNANDVNGKNSKGLITCIGKTKAIVVPTNEELLIAEETLALIN